MRDELEPKAFNFGMVEWVHLAALALAVIVFVSLFVGPLKSSAAFERSADYELSQQEVR